MSYDDGDDVYKKIDNPTKENNDFNYRNKSNTMT